MVDLDIVEPVQKLTDWVNGPMVVVEKINRMSRHKTFEQSNQM